MFGCLALQGPCGIASQTGRKRLNTHAQLKVAAGNERKEMERKREKEERGQKGLRGENEVRERRGAARKKKKKKELVLNY